MTFSIQKLVDGKRKIYITEGNGEGSRIIITEEQFQEIKKAINIDAEWVEVSSFTENKCKVIE